MHVAATDVRRQAALGAGREAALVAAELGLRVFRVRRFFVFAEQRHRLESLRALRAEQRLLG